MLSSWFRVCTRVQYINVAHVNSATCYNLWSSAACAIKHCTLLCLVLPHCQHHASIIVRKKSLFLSTVNTCTHRTVYVHWNICIRKLVSIRENKKRHATYSRKLKPWTFRKASFYLISLNKFLRNFNVYGISPSQNSVIIRTAFNPFLPCPLAGQWPRLLSTTERPHWLRVDFDHWEDEDGSEEEDEEEKEKKLARERMVRMYVCRVWRDRAAGVCLASMNWCIFHINQLPLSRRPNRAWSESELTNQCQTLVLRLTCTCPWHHAIYWPGRTYVQPN